MKAAKFLEGDPFQNRRTYIDGGKITYAWVRPNQGEGNPHTTVVKS